MDAALPVPTWPSDPVDSRCQADDFDALLGILTQLSRKHLLSFRIEVGRVVAVVLFEGEPAAFRDHAWNKEGSLRRFAAERREALADLGLSEASLRQCVRAYFVARELPPRVLDGLVLNHLNLLAQVEDDERRALLARMVVDHELSGLTLRELVYAIKAGRRLGPGAGGEADGSASGAGEGGGRGVEGADRAVGGGVGVRGRAPDSGDLPLSPYDWPTKSNPYQADAYVGPR